MPILRRFRLNAKSYFLTFARCNLDKQYVLEKLRNLQTPSNLKYVKICKELHQDGFPHLHVLLQYEARIQISSQNYFNISSPSPNITYHPNIQAAKSCSDVSNYMNKEGDTLEWGTFQVDPRSARGGRQTCNEAYAQALNSGSKQSALEVIRELAPKDFVLQYHNLNSNLERIFMPPIEPYVPPFLHSTFNNVPDELEEWAADYIKEVQPIGTRPLSVVIQGESRTGKTMWARSLGPHNYLCGHLDLSPRIFSNEAWYNVIDDVDPHYLKHFKEFMGAQRDWQSNTKYGRPIRVKGGIPTIFLCNPGPSSSFEDFLNEEKNHSLKDWAYKNALFVNLYEPLFKEGSASV